MSTGEVHTWCHSSPKAAPHPRLHTATCAHASLYHIYTKTRNPVTSFALHTMNGLGVGACDSAPCILPKVQYIICGRSPAKSSQLILAWEE